MLEFKLGIPFVNNAVASQKGVGCILDIAGKTFANRAEVFVY